MGRLSDLPNIGKVLEQQLYNTGIETPEKLYKTGSKQAWLSIKALDPSACYHRLCALEGAIQGIRWHNLPEHTKEDLKKFYQQNKTG